MRRIIPARAGFTIKGPSSLEGKTDHPRSRGVYSEPRLSDIAKHGSSPLARGLRPRLVVGGTQARIIPARAGFTDDPAPHQPAPSDHPRSRGVYPAGWGLPGRGIGSSPLARGLPISPRGL